MEQNKSKNRINFPITLILLELIKINLKYVKNWHTYVILLKASI